MYCTQSSVADDGAWVMMAPLHFRCVLHNMAVPINNENLGMLTALHRAT